MKPAALAPLGRARPLWLLSAVLLPLSVLAGARAEETPSPADARLRVIVETDAGGDPDDEQSLVRFMLYTNEWDVEGIIANRPVARGGENRNAVRDGLGIVHAMIDAYGACHDRLVEHDPRYPSPENLAARAVAGYENIDDGVELILEAVDRDDPRPVWFLNWGTDRGSAPSSLLRALDRVLRERGAAGYAAFKNKLRLASYDAFGDHTTEIAPPWPLWVDTFRPEIDGRRWYHLFSAITATAGGFDVERDMLHNHGPLGAMYPLNTTHPQKEGDSMTFLYLIPTGMNDPSEPTWGSWAGRYALQDPDSDQLYYWATAEDDWHGSENRENTLRRWAEHLQNDFRARLDWCVQPRDAANHPPHVLVQEQPHPTILRLDASPETTVSLTSQGTTDPDGDALSYEWFQYREAGSYHAPVEITDADQPSARVVIPREAAGKTIHLLLTVTDDGDPPLTRYRRIVVSVARD